MMKLWRLDSDYWLTTLTTLVLLGIGLLCLFGMFYYKEASGRPDWNVIGYQMMMNRLASPLVIALCLLLGLTEAAAKLPPEAIEGLLEVLAAEGEPSRPRGRSRRGRAH